MDKNKIKEVVELLDKRQHKANRKLNKIKAWIKRHKTLSMVCAGIVGLIILFIAIFIF